MSICSKYVGIYAYSFVYFDSKVSAQESITEAKSEQKAEDTTEEGGARAKSGWDEKSSGGKRGGRGKRRGLGLFSGSKGGPEEARAGIGERSKSHRAFEDNDDEDTETFIIPDIDEGREEDFQLTVAEAPATRYRLPTARELDEQLPRAQWREPRGESDDVDISILVRLLEPPQNILEPDELWDKDRLFEEVSQSLTKERVSKRHVEAPQLFTEV